MPLIIICGTPVSGKSTRAIELKEFFEKKHGKSVEIVSEDEAIVKLGYEKNLTYLDSQKEKRVRGYLKSEVMRFIGKENVVILDGSNYIKGCRYELYCASKACKSTQCTIYTIRNHDEAWEANLERISKDSNTELEKDTKGSEKDSNSDNNLSEKDGVGKNERSIDCNKLPYTQEVFDALTKLRFEEPNSNNRWDSPLFTVQPTDQLPLDDVYKVLFEKKPPPPNMSTQNRDTNSLRRAWDNLKSDTRRTRAKCGVIKTEEQTLNSSSLLHYETISEIEREEVPCVCKNTGIKDNLESDPAFNMSNISRNNPTMENDITIKEKNNLSLPVVKIGPTATVEDPVEIGDSNTEQNGNYKTRKPAKIRRDGAVRMKLMKSTKRIETQILKMQPPLSANNFLYELDKVTQTITKHILDAKQVGTSGELKIKEYPNCTLDASFLQFINPPKLSVLRRQFLTFAKMNYVNEDANKIGRYFIQYLNKTLTD